MSLGLKNSILNQKGTPAFYSDTFANRPTYGFAGRVFISTDTGAIYEDTGTAWTLIADAGAGTTGTLQQVTTNGNTTTQGISVSAGGIGTNSLTVSGSRASFYNGTAALLGMTLQNGSVPPTLNRGDLWLYSAASANNNLVLANDLYNSQFLLPLSNQVFTFPNASGTIGLSTSALTAGSVVFAGASGVLSQDNAKFFWDNTNKYLGINTNAPTATFDIHHTTNVAMQLNNDTTASSFLAFQNQSVGKWRIGNNYNAGANSFDIYNTGTATTAVTIDGTTSKATFNGGISTTGTADQQLFVYGSSPSLRLYNTLSSPTVTGFVGMATGVNNFILGSASGDMCIGTSTAGKIFIGSGTTTVSPALTILSSGAATFASTLTTNGNLSVNNGSVYAGVGGPASSRGFYAGNTGFEASFLYNNSTGNLDIAPRSGYSINFNVVTTGLIINDTSGTAAGGIQFQNSGTQKFNLTTIATTNDFGLYNNGGTSSYNLYVKYSTGNVLINSTNDTSIGKLQVRDAPIEVINSYYWLFNTGNSSRYGFLNNGGGALVLNTYGTGNVGSFNMTTGVYTPLSNINKKKDFEQSTIGLNAILNLKPTLFRMKDEENTEKHLGFIAQEVKEFIPQSFVENEDFIGLDYNPIVATLVKAIQELNDKLVKNNIN